MAKLGRKPLSGKAMPGVVTVRLPEADLRRLSLLASIEHSREATLARELLNEALDRRARELVVEPAYRKDAS